MRHDSIMMTQVTCRGHSLAPSLTPGPLPFLPSQQEALHSRNLAFNSAMVVEGKGLGLVVRTGDHTMIGSIASLVGETKTGYVCVPIHHAAMRSVSLEVGGGHPGDPFPSHRHPPMCEPTASRRWRWR